jgi:hypothetical protein
MEYFSLKESYQIRHNKQQHVFQGTSSIFHYRNIELQNEEEEEKRGGGVRERERGSRFIGKKKKKILRSSYSWLNKGILDLFNCF